MARRRGEAWTASVRRTFPRARGAVAKVCGRRVSQDGTRRLRGCARRVWDGGAPFRLLLAGGYEARKAAHEARAKGHEAWSARAGRSGTAHPLRRLRSAPRRRPVRSARVGAVRPVQARVAVGLVHGVCPPLQGLARRARPHGSARPVGRRLALITAAPETEGPPPNRRPAATPAGAPRSERCTVPRRGSRLPHAAAERGLPSPGRARGSAAARARPAQALAGPLPRSRGRGDVPVQPSPPISEEPPTGRPPDRAANDRGGCAAWDGADGRPARSRSGHESIAASRSRVDAFRHRVGSTLPGAGRGTRQRNEPAKGRARDEESRAGAWGRPRPHRESARSAQRQNAKRARGGAFDGSAWILGAGDGI